MNTSDHALENSLITLFNSGRDAMFLADTDGCFTHVNKAFLELYGYTQSDIIGMPVDTINSNLHDQEFYDHIARTLAEKGEWSGDIRNIRKDGEVVHVWTRLTRIDSGLAGIQIDLQERDRATRHMQQINRLEAVSTLAGGIAHEFNNILAGIQGHLHLLKRSIPTENEKEQARMQRIFGLISRASDLVQNILLFSRQKATSSKKVVLSQLLEETLPLIQASLSSKIDVSLDIKDRGMIVMADPVQLRHIFMEIAANAAYALKQSPHRPHRLEITLKKQAQHAQILFADNANGMTEEVLQHCLNPFYTTKPVGEGTGLGLSSASGYITQIDGELDIHSKQGQGSSVCITLPLEHLPLEASNHGLTILLADDDNDVRHSIKEILEHAGHHVISACNGREALALWQQHQHNISAILMDIVMPEVDGLEVAAQIRNENPDIPVFMMTGYSQQRLSEDLHAYLLRKPVDPHILLQYFKNIEGPNKAL